MKLPPQYAWLNTIGPLPKMVIAALDWLDLAEVHGTANNPIIMGWAKELKLPYDNDETAWCGLFMAHVAAESGKPIPAAPLWALNWAKWGEAATNPDPALGDVVVFERRNSRGQVIGGHVGLAMAVDAKAIHVLGGNEGDKVNIIRIVRARLKAVRRFYKLSPPASARTYEVAASGALSQNEA